MRARLLCIALLATGHAACAAGAAPNDNASLGINLGGVTYWSSEIVFVDLFKHSQTFKSQAPGKGYAQGGPLDLTDDGYVRSLAGGGHFADSIVLSQPTLGYPEGIYTCLYDGRGKIAFAYGVETVEERPGRVRIHVRADQNLLTLRVTETDPSDPVRHIRVILPGFEQTYDEQPFHPDFLKRWERFSTLRFMDFQRTNDSKQTHWSDRATPAFQTQGDDAGVALEYMIRLSNTLGADPWFCMPHMASDDYVRSFAEMVKARLAPGLKIYVEYSNECWNGIFAQARYCRDKGKEMGLSDNDYQAQLRYYSKRSVEIFRIWEEVFGDADRLVRVLAAQSANPWTSEQVMDFERAYEHADALGIAPYFGNALGDPKRQDEVAQITVDEVLDRCAEFIAEGNTTIARQAKLATQRGLRLVAYEGGQHLVGHSGAENNEKMTELFHAANRHPRMKQLYLNYLAGWKQHGGTLMSIFSSMGTYSKWGSWGLLEYHGQDPAEAPKYQAVIQFLQDNPKWW
ncbi:MAG: hypothetical protein RBR19_09690 [Sedimentisphaerales bacterium]|jgi:hypothetical protein|nr:hypothetical protein [Sedimentisphaerales bacterium]